jgi:hypothetical protein
MFFEKKNLDDIPDNRETGNCCCKKLLPALALPGAGRGRTVAAASHDHHPTHCLELPKLLSKSAIVEY